MSGRLLAGLLTGTTSPWAELHGPGRVHPIHEMPSVANKDADTVRHFVGDRIGAVAAAPSRTSPQMHVSHPVSHDLADLRQITQRLTTGRHVLSILRGSGIKPVTAGRRGPRR
jgi:hypothetical protein